MDDSMRERLLALSRRELAGLLAVSILVVAGAAFWYVRSLPKPIRIESIAPHARPAARAPAVRPSPSAIVVDVAGWVRRPGVYEFQQGDRVIDAIRRAGGARKGADLTSLNLAALLADAQQVLITKKGTEAAPGGAGKQGGETPGTVDGKVNLNTATLDQLEGLPGIGEVLAQRIIEYREEHGPYRTVEDLLNVSGIGDARLADVREKVMI